MKHPMKHPSKYSASDTGHYAGKRFIRFAPRSIHSIFLLLLVCCCPAKVMADTTKVAFIADQGIGSDAQAVLRLIANEDADLLLIQGDFGYGSSTAETWKNHLDSILGNTFPVLGIAGNHDDREWSVYKQFLQNRAESIGELSCTGNVAVKSLCRFRGIDMVHVSPGIHEIDGVLPEDNYPDYINQSFSGSDARWRICGWHKNMERLQVGTKGDATGYGVYQACLENGAIVVNGHEHSYSRSYLMSDFSNQSVIHNNTHMELDRGRSFVVVSGIGGQDVHAQSRFDAWWASTWTATQGGASGALFCDFAQSTAECYFKDIRGVVPDYFTLASRLGSNAANQSGYVFSRTDINEFRWIDRDAAGRLGNVWIDSSCASSLGGPSEYGNWTDLVNRSRSETDTIPSPCADPVNEQPPVDQQSASGFVFARTDISEFRWIGPDGSGRNGNVWITAECAASLGGAVTSGNWTDLVNLSSAQTDTITSPCSVTGNTVESSGYVFSRTDIQEFRWIDRGSNGEFGNVWIDAACAAQLGGASVFGDWSDLVSRSGTGVDTLPNPCSESMPPDGYLFARSDITEYRWIATDASGVTGSVWVGQQCAASLGPVRETGDWSRLLSLAPGFDSIPSPCQ